VLALVRGDANRIVGHEAEALRDYATAVAAIDLERRSDDRPAEADESAPARHSGRRHVSAANSSSADPSAAPDPDVSGFGFAASDEPTGAEPTDAQAPHSEPPEPRALNAESPDPKENS
jgi:hypothetical protein